MHVEFAMYKKVRFSLHITIVMYRFWTFSTLDTLLMGII